MYKEIPVVAVAAMSAERRVIGNKNNLAWHIPEDLKRFRDLTRGHPIIMGRKTFESILSILGKPLPKRPNIVVTRNTDYTYEGVEVVDSFEAGLAAARAHNPTEIHIGGGAEMYTLALPYTDKLFLTFVHDEPEGDAFFPAFQEDFTEVARSELFDHKGIKYEFVDFIRK